MTDLYTLFFGPLGKDWCLYYFFLLVFVFIAVIITSITAITGLFYLKSLDFKVIYLLFVPVFFSLVTYLQSRILYSICIGALQ